MPNYERNIRLILFLILPILGFLLGWSLSQKNAGPPAVTVKIEETKGAEVIEIPQIKPKKRNIKPKNVDLDIFWETWNSMEENFLHNEKLNVREQIYGATKGLISSLKDPYTVFMTPEDTQKFEESISGEFEGIGAEIAIRNEQLVVVSPLKGSPAELAGLRAGDVIFKIDNEPTIGISVEEAVTRIRGPKGEKVALTVLRNGEKNPIEITIVRDNIILKSVEWKMKDDVAVVTVSQFGTEMTREFQEAIPEILLQNPRGMILDFRNDGGGLLDACVKLASEFLDQKVIVKTKGRNFGDSGEIMSGNSGAFLDMPLVVLINKGSASASEIFAGSIQDHYRGVILGEKSFGKGSVQNVIPLSDGSSLKVTIAEWLTPGGKSINEVGIEPDEEIKITEEDLSEGRDPVLDRALDLVGTDEAKDILEDKKMTEEESSESKKEEVPITQ
ncbi:S41 family peptidase [Candidatus Gracilibacteria bacterium]|nr:S41 family peptidase [Candidatus Gracilibacteria bacterium]